MSNERKYEESNLAEYVSGMKSWPMKRLLVRRGEQVASVERLTSLAPSLLILHLAGGDQIYEAKKLVENGWDLAEAPEGLAMHRDKWQQEAKENGGWLVFNEKAEGA